MKTLTSNKDNSSKDKMKTYLLVNKSNGARVTSTEKYLLQWIARGFIVEEIHQNNR